MSLYLALFARPPLPGQTKTRLVPALGAEGAAELYRAFLEDALRNATRLRELHPDVELALYSADPEPGAFLRDCAERASAALELQSGADLGARMSHALARGIAAKGAALVLGSDTPTLPLRTLVAARAALVSDAPAGARGVSDPEPWCIAPASDGGYVLVGARGQPPSFAGVRMGTGSALADTLAANPARPPRRLPPWYDVDTPADLRLLGLHLRLDPGAAPHTARLVSNLGDRPQTC